LPAELSPAALDDALFQQLFQNAPVPCHELDARGFIRRVNRKWCALLGYDESKLVGKPVWEFLAPRERQQAQTGFAKKLDRERFLVPFEREYIRADGSSIIVEIHDQLLTTPAGDVEGIRSVLIDVTEQHLAAAELRRANAWLNSVLHALPHGIITTDVLGVVVSMNAAAERITGWTQYEALGREIESILGLEGDTRAAAHKLAAILSGQSWSLCLAGTEQPRPALVTFSAVTDRLGSVIGAIAQIQELHPHTPPSTAKM
jgi:PAS domain S-box-containing protein